LRANPSQETSNPKVDKVERKAIETNNDVHTFAAPATGIAFSYLVLRVWLTFYVLNYRIIKNGNSSITKLLETSKK
jgi:hypothetical protein